MPATIEALLLGKPEPVTALLKDRLPQVLLLMIKHDYSQLPIVDDGGKPLGLVTSDSIVRALHNFGAKTDELCVKDAMLRRPSTYYPSDDVFDLLDDLKASDAVLVIDAQGKLIGIITTSDTTAYLRQRAQDIMVVQEIEEMIKSYTNIAFTAPSGEIEIDKQNAAIAEITPSNAPQKGKFRKALVQYLARRDDANAQIDATALDAAFDAYLHEKPNIKPFDKLTLGEYINLLLHQSRWSFYSSVFSVDREAIRRLLDKVRQTRNALAHFRDDITPDQREELRFAKEWLARHETEINRAFGLDKLIGSDRSANPSPSPGTRESPGVPDGQAAEVNGPPAAPGEDGSAGSSSRYAPLIQHLLDQPIAVERRQLSFAEIDALLGDHRLPESARKYRAWWANNAAGHSHSQQWLDAGWRVANVNMTEERVTFARTKEYEQRYISFFSALRLDLERAAPGVFQFSAPDGQYYLTIAHVYWENRHLAYFHCAFTRTKRFRVELFIDAHDSVQSKQIFDALNERRDQIESEFGEALSWERLDSYGPARIARYYPGTIMDGDDTLANLRARAVEAAQRFYPALDRHITAILPDVLSRRLTEERETPTP